MAGMIEKIDNKPHKDHSQLIPWNHPVLVLWQRLGQNLVASKDVNGGSKGLLTIDYWVIIGQYAVGSIGSILTGIHYITGNP